MGPPEGVRRLLFHKRAWGTVGFSLCSPLWWVQQNLGCWLPLVRGDGGLVGSLLSTGT